MRRPLIALGVLLLLMAPTILVGGPPLIQAEPFDPFNPYFQPVILERGVNYVVSDLGLGKRSWESAPQWVFDGSKYVPYIYSRDDAKKCYNVQVGFVAAKVYDTGIVELYDPELKEVRVKGESWEVWSAGKQATLNSPIIWSVVTNSSGVFITRRQTTSKPDGTLEIVYSFLVGASLKNTVKWTSAEVKPVTVQVKQVDLMDFDKVTTETGTSTTSKSEKSVAYLFGYGSKDFWLLMDQSQMVYDTKSLESTPPLLTEKCLQTGEIDFAGKKVTYTFGDWTLATGEALEIDPSPATLSDPTEDGCIMPTYTRDKTGNYLNIGTVDGDKWRSYAQWPTTSIPDTATITDTVFKYNGQNHAYDCHIHAMANKPKDATDANAYADCADGTVYADVAGFPVVGTNKVIDLGATADSDLKGLLASDWFAIGIQADAETGNWYYSAIYSEEYASTPDPTLYVEYTDAAPPTDYPRAGAATFTLGKAGTRLLSAARGAAKAFTLTEAGARLAGLLRSAEVINGFNLANAAARSMGFVRASSGAFTLASAGTTLMGWVRGVTEDITFTGVATRLFEALRDAAQTINTKLDATRLFDSIRVATQGMTLTSSVARLFEWVRDATQSIQFGDMATRLAESFRDAAQGLTFASAAARVYDAVRAAAQSLTLTSGAANIFGWVRAAAQSLTMASGAARLVEAFRDAAQNLVMANAGTRLFEFVRGASQGLTFASAADRVVGFIRAAVQGLTLNSATTRVWGMLRDATQGLTIANAATRLFDSVRAATQDITFSSGATRLLDLIRSAIEDLTVTSGASRLVDMLRDAAQGLTLDSFANIVLGHIANIFRSVSQGIIVTVDAARSMELFRSTSQGITLALGGVGYLAINYIVNVSLNIIFKSWGWGVLNLPLPGGVVTVVEGGLLWGIIIFLIVLIVAAFRR